VVDGGIDGRRRGDILPFMVALKTTATVDQSRTLAVLLPECGVEAGEYEVLVVLNNPGESVRAPLTFSDHRLGANAGATWSRSEIYGDDGR
jgi:hypothetical protein